MRRMLPRGSRRTLVVFGTLWAVLLAVPAPSRPDSPRGQAKDAEYLHWLEERSMLYQARQAAKAVSGRGVQWRHPFGTPKPREAVKTSSVWLLDYPGSVITKPGRSVIATWGDPKLWDVLQDIGIDLLHTGPVNLSGGVEGKKFTPTLDGWFDRISLELDPDLGSEEEYARMVAVAGKRGATIAGDLVPLHTGTGADFQLALRAYKDYPGMYKMVEIAREDWGLLPEAKGPWELKHVPKKAVEQLAEKGYLPGRINSNDAAKEAKNWSGWSASGEVRGADGKVRRWVYLHSFKQTQPALNWSDPSFAAQRALAGDVVRTVYQRQTRAVRLDAVPFLGLEPKPGKPEALHFKHPLAVSGTNYLAFLIRKMGGFSFHELNVPLEDLKKYTESGPDLSYDFYTRAQIMHALLSGDAGPLRLSFQWFLDAEVQPLAFVHDLQNHDEITFQLNELEHRKDQALPVGGKKVKGGELREGMIKQMQEKAAGEAAPYNRLYRPQKDGLATTFAGFIAPALGVRDPYNAGAEQLARVRQGHLLLAAANALQPGVFSLSSWDLVGALPIPEKGVKDWIADGDYRWINRGGVDLMGANPDATKSAFGIPRAKALYGSLPEQLEDPKSFASQLKRMLAARKKHRIAEAELLAVPETKEPALCLLVLRLPDKSPVFTVLNFGKKDLEAEVDLSAARELAKAGLEDGRWADMLGGDSGATVSGGRLRLRVRALYGTTLIRQATQ